MVWLRVFIGAMLCMLAGQAALAYAPSTSLRPHGPPCGNYQLRAASKSACGFSITPALDQNRALCGLLIRSIAAAPKPTLMWRCFYAMYLACNAHFAPPHGPKICAALWPVPRAYRQPLVPQVTGPRRGSVCGDRGIRGQAIARIRGRISACGIANPVKVTEVDGVKLSTPATIDCTTAKALKQWVHNGAKPAVGRMGGGIKSLRVVAHYACRTRNNQAGAKISEHGKGRAI